MTRKHNASRRVVGGGGTARLVRVDTTTSCTGSLLWPPAG